MSIQRLFIAIPLSKYMRKGLEDYTQQFAYAYGLRRTAPQNMHITVQFLGEVGEEHVEEIQKRLAVISEATEVFELRLADITWAPPHKEPRMIWANFVGEGQYEALVEKVSDAVDEFVPKDLRDEQVMRKARHPHITLARLKDPAVARSIKLFPPKLKKDTVNVVSFELWASELTPDGPNYAVLSKFLFS